MGHDIPRLERVAKLVSSTKMTACSRRCCSQLTTTRSYGRTVAVCHVDGRDLGADMVADGHAWAFVRYSRDYVEEEREAAAVRAGNTRPHLPARVAVARRAPISPGRAK